MRWAFAILLLLVACDRADEPRSEPRRVMRGEPPSEPTESAVPAVEETGGGVEIEEAQTTDSPTEPEALEPTPEALEAEAARLEATVRDALNAAEEAQTGSTLCESAHEGISAMVRQVAETYPDETRPIPPRLAFMQLCEQLAPEVQRCLIPTHAASHVDECGRITANLSEAQRTRLDTLLSSE